MPSNTNGEAQKQRRRDAWKSAIIATVWMLLSASMLLLLRHFYVPDGFWSAVMLMVGVSAMLIWAYKASPEDSPPVWFLWLTVGVFAAIGGGVVLALMQRIHEIGKGEIDDAKRY